MGQVLNVILEANTKCYYLEVKELPAINNSDVIKSPYYGLGINHASMVYSEGGEIIVIENNQIFSQLASIFYSKEEFQTSFDTYCVVDMNYTGV